MVTLGGCQPPSHQDDSATVDRDECWLALYLHDLEKLIFFSFRFFVCTMKTLFASAVCTVTTVCVKYLAEEVTWLLAIVHFFTGTYLHLGIDLLRHLLAIAFQKCDGFFQRFKELIGSSLSASYSQKVTHDVN